jgi:ligand-binding SRPBCC domain-containing protein
VLAMTSIHLETSIAAPIDRVFDLARDIDLHARSMAATAERAIAGRTSGRIELGETVSWRARHFGVWWSLTSRIIVVQRPLRFVDEQERGPFRWFRHEHSFEAHGDSTLMTDNWEHVSPFGPLGRLADRLFLTRHMRQLLEVHNAAIKAEAEQSAPGGP